MFARQRYVHFLIFKKYFRCAFGFAKTLHNLAGQNKNSRIMKNALKWATGLLFGICALMALSYQGFLSFLLFSFVSAVCIPPAHSWIQQKTKINLSRPAKYVAVILLWFGAALSFPKPPTSNTPLSTPKSRKPCELTFTDRRGNNYYYVATGFKPNDKDCYNYLRTFALEQRTAIIPPFTLHFLDNLPGFKAPNDKFYGSEEIRRKVIAQYIYFNGSMEDIIFDPLGYDSYKEPNQ
jgi:hypothetical protein